MPCDTVTTQTVNLANAIPAVLSDALKAEHADIWEQTETMIRGRVYGAGFTWEKGKGLEIRSYSAMENTQIVGRVTQAYSRQAVTWAAQRAGWTVKQTEGNKLTVSRM